MLCYNVTWRAANGVMKKQCITVATLYNATIQQCRVAHGVTWESNRLPWLLCAMQHCNNEDRATWKNGFFALCYNEDRKHENIMQYNGFLCINT